MKELRRPYLPKLKRAAARRERLAFVYRRKDGRTVGRDAVYPQSVFRRNGRAYLRAWCVPPGKQLNFRVESIQRLSRVTWWTRFQWGFPRVARFVGVTRDVIRRAMPALVGLGVAGALAMAGAIEAAALVTFGVVVLGGLYIAWTLSGGNPKGGRSRVTRAIDGDTIGVGRGWRYTRVRLIGVDSPETVHPDRPVEPFGPEASAFAKRMLSGRRVQLEIDNRRPYDRYGRLRAYVFTMDGKMANRELVEHGYARVVDTVRFRYYRDFKRREEQARKARVGMWGGR